MRPGIWPAGLFALFAAVLLVWSVPTDSSALSVRSSIVTHVGAGAARLTLYSSGSARLYVNLRQLTPGLWKEELWTGSCDTLGTRVVALRSLNVLASGRVARTNVLSPSQARGRTVRVRHADEVLCSTFTTTSVARSGATNSYVATTGSDSNPGTASSPWRTIQKAINTVAPGSTINVQGGTYAAFSVRRSGTPGAPIVVRAAGSVRPQVVGGGAQTVIDINGSHDVNLSGLDVSGANGPRESGAGIRVQGGAHDIHISNSVIHDNVTQGINISDGVRVIVSGNDVSHNEIGIQVTRAGDGVQILDNAVHDNDRMVVNTPSPTDDDYGGVGIGLVGSTGAVTISGNRLWANRAVSDDYGWDGGAFEIFGASNATITDNVTWDNENILETGTNGPACDNNVFARNISYGAVTRGRSLGIFLRCASNMRVVNNTIADLGSWAFSILGDDRFSGSIDGLLIANNIVTMEQTKIYGFEVPLPDSAVVAHNVIFNSSGGEIATVVGHGSTDSAATLRLWLHQPTADIVANPDFVDRNGHDYHLAAGSPAIDAGIVVPGITDHYAGAAPDAGRWEYVPTPN